MPAAPPTDPNWEQKLRFRLMDFEATTRKAGLACSLKWRTVRGRFDRRSSPAAYMLIDQAVRGSAAPGRWVEVHSNGPELLAYLGNVAGGLVVERAVATLLAEMACARAAGARSGDRMEGAIELIVRRFDECGCYVEQVLLSVAAAETASEADVAAALGRHGIAVGA